MKTYKSNQFIQTVLKITEADQSDLQTFQVSKNLEKQITHKNDYQAKNNVINVINKIVNQSQIKDQYKKLWINTTKQRSMQDLTKSNIFSCGMDN